MPETAEWSVGLAQANDLDWLADNDHHIPPSTIEAKIRAGEYLIARAGSERIGGMRFGLFCSTIPIVEMIWVADDQRRKGIGRAFIEWLEDMGRFQSAAEVFFVKDVSA